MRNFKCSYRLHATVAAFALIGGSSIAQAQQAQQALPATQGPAAADEHGADSSSVDEIVVTAQKVRQNINDVGMSITALSGTQLTDRGITTPEGLTKAVTGLNIITGGTNNTVYTLRGIGFYDAAIAAPPTVSLYLDEMPVPFPSMARGVARDIRQIEVLKGPQGTLYGQNATGGSINFIANRPTDTLKLGADIDYGSYNKIDGSAFISGPITSTLRARLSVSATDGGAWQKSYTVGDTHGATRTYTGRLLVDWDPTDRLTLQFNANGWIDKSDEIAGQLVALVSDPARQSAALKSVYASYPATPPDARYADWDHGVPYGLTDTRFHTYTDPYRRDAHFKQLGLRAGYHLGDVTLTSITTWAKLNQWDFYDADGMNGNSYNATNGGSFETFAQELRAAGTIGKVQWIIGGNYQHDKIYQEGSIYNTIGTFAFRSAHTLAYEDFKTVSAFANLTYSLTDTLDVIGGVRYSDVRITNRGCTLDGGDGAFAALLIARAAAHGVNISINPGDCITLDPVTYQPVGLFPNKLNQTNVPFKLGINWKPTPDTLTYVTVSRGYKAGLFPLAGAQFTPQLDPAVQEQVVAYEAGFKQSLLDRKLQINGAIFRMDYTNKQVRGKQLDPTLGLVNKTINVPQSRVIGAEIEALWAPDSHWNFAGSVGYLHTEILDNYTNYSFGGKLMNMNGQPLPLSPKWQASGDVQYETPVSSRLDLFAGGHVKHMGETFSGLGAEALFKTRAYTNFDLLAGVKAPDGRWKVTAYVNNVTNVYSWNFVTLTGPDTVVRNANLPRTFGIRLSIRN